MRTRKRGLRVGLVIEGIDHFIRPIEAELRRRHRVDRFQPHFVRLPLIGMRVNEILLERQLKQFLHEHNVVFFEWAGPLAAMASHQFSRTRKVVRAHRIEIFSMLKEFDWSSIETVIFVSQAMRSRFLKEFPDRKEASRVVNNGVDLKRFTPKSKLFAWRIGMLGHITPRKRVYDVISALTDLPSNLPWQLFVGGGPVPEYLDYWDALQGLVYRLGVRDRVHFSGHVNDPSMWLRNIDIFVSASHSEGQQVALIESMALGCYCLGHCWDGVEEMLPAENIFTTHTDLRTKLLAYADWPEEEKKQAQAQMRAIAEAKFNERRMVRAIIDIIEKVAVS